MDSLCLRSSAGTADPLNDTAAAAAVLSEGITIEHPIKTFSDYSLCPRTSALDCSQCGDTHYCGDYIDTHTHTEDNLTTSPRRRSFSFFRSVRRHFTLCSDTSLCTQSSPRLALSLSVSSERNRVALPSFPSLSTVAQVSPNSEWRKEGRKGDVSKAAGRKERLTGLGKCSSTANANVEDGTF